MNDLTRSDDLLWRHLKGVPAFRALLRAVEARFFQNLELPDPVLDLGCGDGHFAGTTFLAPLDVGADPCWDSLQEAHSRGAHRLVIQAAGSRLPYEDRVFGAVISNSVLEHVEDVDAVLREAARVVRPGGLMIFTVPSEYFARFLSISSALRRIGLERAAASYEDWFNRISRHHHCDPPGVWHWRLTQAGLQVDRWHYYFSRRAHHRLEWGHYLGLPAVVSKLIFGHWVIAPWRSSLRWTERWLRPYYQEPPPEQGAYLFFLARRLLPTEEPGPLPPPSPGDYSVSECDRPVPLPRSISETGTAPLAREPSRPAVGHKGLDSEPKSGPRVGSIAWLALAILLAVIGQTSWNWWRRPFQPGDGFIWYGLALLSFAIFAWQSHTGRRVDSARGRLSAEALYLWSRGRLRHGAPLFFALTLSWFAWTRVLDVVRPPIGPVGPLLIWIAGIGLALVALWPAGRAWLARLARLGSLRLDPSAPSRGVDDVPPRRRLTWNSWPRWEFAAVGLLVVVAFLLRFVDLNSIPYILSGDEGNMGREAARVLSGELANPFITGWFSHPVLYFFLLALPIRLFGHTIVAVRFLSPIAGALAVAMTYLFARRAWGRSVALGATVLLAGYHFHIHYSRLALNNVWDPVFALLVLGLLWRGWQSGDRRHYLVSGLGLGLGQYFYQGSRLLLVMLAILLLYWALVDRRRLWGQRGNLAALAAVVLVVALPILLFSVNHWDDYMARVNQLGIYQSGWLEREIASTGSSETSILWEQLWKSALAYNYTPDPTFWYRPGIPLLRFVPSVLFVFGLGLALVRIKRTPEFLLLMWIGTTIIFAGVLLENPPASQRYIISAPAVCLLIALALGWMGRRLRKLLGGRKKAWSGALLLLALWIAWGDVSFYFGAYTASADFGGLNTEVAHRAAEYLRDLGPDWKTFFFGLPRMGISPQGGFPSVSFLVPDANTVDVVDPLNSVSDLPDLQPPTVFIYLPERAMELQLIRAAFPHGTEKHFPGRYARMLFVAYEVP